MEEAAAAPAASQAQARAAPPRRASRPPRLVDCPGRWVMYHEGWRGDRIKAGIQLAEKMIEKRLARGYPSGCFR